MVVSLEPHSECEGKLVLPVHDLGLPADEAFSAHDRLHDAHYTWQGTHHYLRLSPDRPAHIFRLEPAGTSEQTHAAYDRLVHA